MDHEPGCSEHRAKEESTFSAFRGRKAADTKHRWLRFRLVTASQFEQMSSTLDASVFSLLRRLMMLQ